MKRDQQDYRRKNDGKQAASIAVARGPRDSGISCNADSFPCIPTHMQSGTIDDNKSRAAYIPRFRQVETAGPERTGAGFTLLELLIVIAILSILMGFAVPAMTGLLKNDRLVAQINTLAGHLAQARSEAVTRHQSTILCASDDLAGCSSNDWADGWIVFVDNNDDADFTAADEILSQYQGSPDDTSLSASMGSKVIYNGRGFVTNTFGSFALCDDRGVEYMRSISIQRTGRVYHGGAASC